ncbi:hypothetical protein MASR2M78_17780 [Treponema sp.]
MKKMKNPWYGRPKAALCLSLAILAIAILYLQLSSRTDSSSSAIQTYAVTLQHFGIDAREMERTIAIPLEEELSQLQGLKSLASQSEYGRVRLSISLYRSGESYEAVRDAVQGVYENLAPSVQRPEFVSSDDSRNPVWVAAVPYSPSIGSLLEKTLKPVLQGLNGVAEVQVSGIGIGEIVLELDEEKAVAAGLDSLSIAASLASSDAFFPSGSVHGSGQDMLISADGRYANLAGLRNALILNKSAESLLLSDFCKIEELNRESGSLSRLNGKRVAALSVMRSSRSDLRLLSREIARALIPFEEKGLEITVLSDLGAEESHSYSAVFAAMIQASFMVSLAAALLSSHYSRGQRRAASLLILSVSVPFVLIVSAALLRLRYSLDALALAGLSSGLGSALDALLLSSEGLAPCRSLAEGRASLRRLAPSVLSGTATTLVVLLPLSRFEEAVPGISRLSLAIAFSNLVALLFAFLLLPPLWLAGLGVKGKEAKPRRIKLLVRKTLVQKQLRRKARRLLSRCAWLCFHKPLVPLFVASLISLGGMGALYLVGVQVNSTSDTATVIAHLDFESGTSKESIDERLSPWAEQLVHLQGLCQVQTSSYTGYATALITFDPKFTNRNKVVLALRKAPPSGGFVYIAEAQKEEALWELSLSGEEDSKCRELLGTVAQVLRKEDEEGFIKEIVFNFKTGPERLILKPERARLAQAGLSFAVLSDSLRRSLYGPVVYKRLDEGGETDLRILGSKAGAQGREGLKNLSLLGPDSEAQSLSNLVSFSSDFSSSCIQRRDRRRVASLSLRTSSMDPRKARKVVLYKLRDLEFPRGYSLDFDPSAIEAAENISASVYAFLLALFLSYFVIAAVTESFWAPLAALSAIPFSLSVPALILTSSLKALDAVSCCAFVLVSGIVVNASVLMLDEIRRRSRVDPRLGIYALYRSLRSRSAALSATSATTIAGTFPFLFLSSSENPSARALAFVTCFGVASSYFAALFIIPSLVRLQPRFFYTTQTFEKGSSV